MNHTALMGGSHSGTNLPGDLDAFVLREASNPTQRRCEVFPSTYSIDRYNSPFASPMSCTRQTFGCDTSRAVAYLVVEFRESRRVVAETFREKFQRDWLPEPEIVGSVHLAHSTAAKHHDATAMFALDSGRAAAPAAGPRAGPADRRLEGAPLVGRRALAVPGAARST